MLFAENGTKDDLLATIRGIRKDALAAVEHFLQFADVYEAGDGEYPDRFGLSALAARLLCEQQLVTARWAAWAEDVVSSWDEPLGADAAWGIEALRATGNGW